MIKKIKAVIFDLDGTLVSSRLDFNWLRQQISCPENEDILTFTANLSDPKLQQRAHAIIEQHELDDAQAASWLPGAKRLVNHLHRHNYPLAIVTRNFSEAAQIKLRNNTMPITRVITREDAPAKPDPTALLMVAEEWHLTPEQIMYIGDYRYDIEAANRASMMSCLYAPDKQPDYASQADIVIQHFDELTRKMG